MPSRASSSASTQKSASIVFDNRQERVCFGANLLGQDHSFDHLALTDDGGEGRHQAREMAQGRVFQFLQGLQRRRAQGQLFVEGDQQAQDGPPPESRRSPCED